MRKALILLSVLFNLFSFTPVFAQMVVTDSASAWEPSVTSAIGTRYTFPKSGYEAYGKPVIQTDLSFTKEHWTLSIWNSSALSEPGAYGNRGYGDEIDFIATYNRDFGWLSFEGSVAYWVTANFADLSDDTIQLYANVGHSFALTESVSVKPYMQFTHWKGLGMFPDTTFVDFGASLDVALDDRWNASLDASYSRDITNSVPILNTSARISYDVAPGWSLFVSASAAERIKPAFMIGFTASGSALAGAF